jgi:hypothetical protein
MEYNMATKQHSLLGNRFLISKYTQPLLGNAFRKQTNSHRNNRSTTMNGVFYTVHIGMS